MLTDRQEGLEQILYPFGDLVQIPIRHLEGLMVLSSCCNSLAPLQIALEGQFAY
jgi:hypothetical protein